MVSIHKWNPVRDFDRVFNQFFGENAELAREWTGWTPACDLLESQDEVRILMDLPGVRKEDLDIQLKDAKTVIVRGERKPVTLDQEKVTARRLERISGHFARAFFLPYEVNSESITANFREGVLEVVLRKPESIKPRKIEISAE